MEIVYLKKNSSYKCYKQQQQQQNLNETTELFSK